VRVFPFEKGPANGEAHRHTALREAKGRLVAHIDDDDLWFPNHLAEMAMLLEEVDFGHTLQVYAESDGSFRTVAADLARPQHRARILNEPFCTMGHTVTGYRLDAYRRLPEGWAPTMDPPPLTSSQDLKMWRKFLRREDLKFGTRMAITALIFDTERRRHLSIDERAQEIGEWCRRLLDPSERERIVRGAWRSLVLDFLHADDDRRSRRTVIESLQAQVRSHGTRFGGRLQVGSPIDFTGHGSSFLYTVSGWSYQEADHRWTEGHEASISVQLESSPAGRVSEVRMMRFRAVPLGTSQRVVVSVAGKTVAALDIAGSWRDYEIDVDLSSIAERSVTDITFQLPDACTPTSLGFNADPRILGIALKSLTFLRT
jgi:hypothetical protein